MDETGPKNIGPEQGETKTLPEQMKEFAEKLGFPETPELKAVSERTVEAMLKLESSQSGEDWNQFVQVMTELMTLGEAINEDDTKKPKERFGQAGLGFYQASALLQGHMYVGAYEATCDARWYFTDESRTRSEAEPFLDEAERLSFAVEQIINENWDRIKLDDDQFMFLLDRYEAISEEGRKNWIPNSHAILESVKADGESLDEGEAKESEPTLEGLVKVLKEIDPEITEEEFLGYDVTENIGEAVSLLMRLGIDDPYTWLAERGILEPTEE